MKTIFLILSFFSFCFSYDSVATATNLNMTLNDYNFAMALIGSIMGSIFFGLILYLTILVTSSK